jgi:hypothetical protein
MANRDRIIYQSLGVLVGPTGALPDGASLTGIQRVQSVTHNAAINRKDVNQFGNLARIDQQVDRNPTVGLNFECYLVNAINANRLGLTTDGSVSCVAGILSGVTDIHNFYVPLAPEGSDLVSTTGAGAFTFGNCFISNITYQAAVGDFAKESYQIQALNYEVHDISSGNVPTVDPQTGLLINGIDFVIPVVSSGTANSVTAIRHGDITANITNTLGFIPEGLHLQNFNISIPINREDILQLGSRFAFSKKIQFPVNVTASFDAVAGDIAAGGLTEILCNDTPFDMTISLREPSCSGNGTVAIEFLLKQMKLQSTNFNSSIGPNVTTTFTFTTQLGSAQQTDVGLFISGISS